jgi:hypothetical protein
MDKTIEILDNPEQQNAFIDFALDVIEKISLQEQTMPSKRAKKIIAILDESAPDILKKYKELNPREQVAQVQIMAHQIEQLSKVLLASIEKHPQIVLTRKEIEQQDSKDLEMKYDAIEDCVIVRRR